MNEASGALGLLQIIPRWWMGHIERLGYTVADLLLPEPNLRVGLEIHRTSGFAPWEAAPLCGL